MKRIFRFYPLTLLVIVLVTTVCLMPIEDPPLKDVPFIDKWTHMALFGGILSVLLFELTMNGRLFTRWKWYAALFSIAYGGAIEIMQATLTTCRSGEWLDFFADAFGVVVLFPVSFFILKTLSKRCFTSE